MKNGLIVYNKIDEKKNEWFIDRCLEELNDDYFSLLYKEESDVLSYIEENKIDFVIYRARDYRLIKALEDLGIKVFNNSLTNKVANDKFETFLFCKQYNIPCIETSLDISNIKEFPIVMKKANGHGGQDVHLIRRAEEQSQFDDNDKFIYQPFISDASDVRLYVLNNQVVAAVKRENTQDFRSNFSLGGSVSLFMPSEKMKEIALKTSSLLKADFVGVDFIINDKSIFLNEIEDPVGSRMLYKTSDIDIISLFISYIKNSLKQQVF